MTTDDREVPSNAVLYDTSEQRTRTEKNVSSKTRDPYEVWEDHDRRCHYRDYVRTYQIVTRYAKVNLA